MDFEAGEEAFLRAHGERPDDLDLLAVYADWLEEHDQLPRAEIVRRHRHVLALAQMSARRSGRESGALFDDERELLARAGELLDLAETMPDAQAWIERLARAPLAGTTWDGTDSQNASCSWRYDGAALPSSCRGRVVFATTYGVHQDSRWLQVGSAVRVIADTGRVSSEAVMVAGGMIGASPQSSTPWTWRASRLLPPAEGATPEERLRAELLARTPDRPASLELRELLLDDTTRLDGDAKGATLVAERLIGLVGYPNRELVERALERAGRGWQVITETPQATPWLPWQRAAIMTLRDEALFERALSAARSATVAPLEKREIPEVPESYRDEIAAALALGGPVICARAADGALASFGYASARTRALFDISIDTVEAYRGRGLAKLTAAALIDIEQRGGRRAVWSALESNAPSLAVARALGFATCGELYVAELG
jgi:uncharacterized protein (TIGR02996 family)